MPVQTRLLTADRPLFEGQVDFLVARGADGDLGVLPQHAPLLTWLRPGEVMVRQGEAERYYFLPSGFLEVLPDLLTVVAEEGWPSSELDLEQAEAQRKAIQDELSHAHEAESAPLHRRLEVAEAKVVAAERQRRRERE